MICPTCGRLIESEPCQHCYQNSVSTNWLLIVLGLFLFGLICFMAVYFSIAGLVFK